MPKIDVSTEPTQIVDADQTQERWMVRVLEDETNDVFIMDEKAPAAEGRGRRIKPGDRAEIHMLDKGLWAWTLTGTAQIEIEPANFSLNIFSPSVQRVERPRDTSEKVGDYSTLRNTFDINGNTTGTIIQESGLGGKYVTKASVLVYDWDANNNGNPITPGQCGIDFRISAGISSQAAVIGGSYLAGSINVDPMLKIPEGYDVYLDFYNETGNQVSVKGTITLVGET